MVIGCISIAPREPKSLVFLADVARDQRCWSELPPDGIMVEHDGTPVCAAGLYIGVGTQFAFMEWIVTDKKAEQRLAHKCLKLCIDRVMELAKKKGMKLVYTATKEQALHKRYTKYHNMVLTESNVKTFLRDLDGSYSKDLTWISDDEQIDNLNK